MNRGILGEEELVDAKRVAAVCVAVRRDYEISKIGKKTYGGDTNMYWHGIE